MYYVIIGPLIWLFAYLPIHTVHIYEKFSSACLFAEPKLMNLWVLKTETLENIHIVMINYCLRTWADSVAYIYYYYIVLVLYYVRLCTLKDRWYIIWANICVCVRWRICDHCIGVVRLFFIFFRFTIANVFSAIHSSVQSGGAFFIGCLAV